MDPTKAEEALHKWGTGRFPDRGGVKLAILSALLLILAQPPFHFILLPFTALVPLAVALGSLDDSPASARRAAWVGLAFGVLCWGFLLIWVPLVVAPRFPWAFPFPPPYLFWPWGPTSRIPLPWRPGTRPT